LATTHNSDEHSILQCRTQIELIDSLEQRVNKERQKFQAMLNHLQMRHAANQAQINAAEAHANLLQSAQLSNQKLELPSPNKGLQIGSVGGVERVSQNLVIKIKFEFRNTLINLGLLHHCSNRNVKSAHQSQIWLHPTLQHSDLWPQINQFPCVRLQRLNFIQLRPPLHQQQAEW
jgi:hypothetical protein